MMNMKMMNMMMMMIALVEIEISGSAWRDRDEVVWSAALHIVLTCTLFDDDDDDDNDDDDDIDDGMAASAHCLFAHNINARFLGKPSKESSLKICAKRVLAIFAEGVS